MRCISVEPLGQWLASGIASTCRCILSERGREGRGEKEIKRERVGEGGREGERVLLEYSIDGDLFQDCLQVVMTVVFVYGRW